MPEKITLIAHRDPEICGRFAAALADARHAYVTSSTADDALARATDASAPVSLALVDAGLHEDPFAWITQLRAGTTRPVLVFAGTVRSATQTRALLTVPVAGYINEHAATAQILPALAPHLFPASFDRRLSPRLSLGVPVTYRAGDSIATSVTLNVGRGGLAVRTLSPLPPGTEVDVKFSPPGTSIEIDVRGRVVWADRKVGMGIQFERVSATDQAAIDQLAGGV